MTLNGMTSLWARSALLWFAVAVSLGLYMGISQNFQFTPAHAHIGVLGWLSSGAYAGFYAAMGERRPGGRAPVIHWAAHTIGVALMTGGLFMAIGLGMERMMAMVVIGSLLVVASVFGALLMLWPRLAATAD